MWVTWHEGKGQCPGRSCGGPEEHWSMAGWAEQADLEKCFSAEMGRTWGGLLSLYVERSETSPGGGCPCLNEVSPYPSKCKVLEIPNSH